MRATIASHTGKALAVGIAAVVLQFAAPAQAFNTGIYDLYNHPDGDLTSTSSPEVHYGLRLDSLCYFSYNVCGGTWTNDERTFSVEANDFTVSSVTLDWGNGGTDFTKATISGTLTYNDASPQSGADPDLWTITYNLENIQALSGADPTAGRANGAANGWYVAADDITGTLTRVTDPITISLKGKNDSNGHAFVFDDDGHRCSSQIGVGECATDAIVARGWMVATKDDPNNPNAYWKDKGANDWLVIAKQDTPPSDDIPEPGTLALFGMGLLGLRYARRRRAA